MPITSIMKMFLESEPKIMNLVFRHRKKKRTEWLSTNAANE